MPVDTERVCREPWCHTSKSIVGATVELTRQVLAYALIGGVLLLTAPWMAVTLHRRQRRKLRQRGIKRYGH